MGQELELTQSAEVAGLEAVPVGVLVAQVRVIQEAMAAAMIENTHYGVIPGTDKPTLFKPGAEKLCLLFRLDPEYTTRTELDPVTGHYSVESTCTLYHIPSGNRVASGQGYCTTKESKYAYRNAQRVCPSCGQAAIIKGKAEYGGGWLCWKKQNGCGAKFADGDETIESQEAGKVPNPDLADSYNTVLKMANKRALIAAVLNGTAASDIFTQDVEDLPSPDIVQTVSPETLAQLQVELGVAAGIAPELWEAEVVLENAKRRFGRNIRTLGELTEAEAAVIANGARSWLELQEAQIVDAEIEEIPFGEEEEN